MEFLTAKRSRTSLTWRSEESALPVDEALRLRSRLRTPGYGASQGHHSSRPETGEHDADQIGVKLLDFGLAKRREAAVQPAACRDAHDPASSDDDSGHDPGTFQYMAPEQLEGKEAEPARTFSRSARLSTRWSPAEGRSQGQPGESHHRDHVVAASAVEDAAAGCATRARRIVCKCLKRS